MSANTLFRGKLLNVASVVTPVAASAVEACFATSAAAMAVSVAAAAVLLLFWGPSLVPPPWTALVGIESVVLDS